MDFNLFLQLHLIIIIYSEHLNEGKIFSMRMYKINSLFEIILILLTRLKDLVLLFESCQKFSIFILYEASLQKQV